MFPSSKDSANCGPPSLLKSTYKPYERGPASARRGALLRRASAGTERRHGPHGGPHGGPLQCPQGRWDVPCSAAAHRNGRGKLQAQHRYRRTSTRPLLGVKEMHGRIVTVLHPPFHIIKRSLQTPRQTLQMQYSPLYRLCRTSLRATTISEGSTRSPTIALPQSL